MLDRNVNLERWWRTSCLSDLDFCSFLKFCWNVTIFSHVHYTDEGPVHISGQEDFLKEWPKLAIKKHDLRPPTYSFLAKETQGNHCNPFFGNSVYSNLRSISGMGCSSLQTLFYCLTFNKGDEENVRSYFSRMKDLLVNNYFICSYFDFEPSFQQQSTALSDQCNTVAYFVPSFALVW